MSASTELPRSLALQQLERAVHRRVTDGAALGAHSLVNLLGGDMALGVEEGLQNQVALDGMLEIVALEILRQRCALEFMRHVARLAGAGDQCSVTGVRIWWCLYRL